MSSKNASHAAALALALVAGCSSPEKQDAVGPGTTPAPTAAPAKAAPEDDRIVVKKGDRTKPEGSYLHRSSPENVSIDVKAADLKTIVLPFFRNQVGVWLDYQGLPRKVDLRVLDLHWREAMNVLCVVTQMHVVPIEGTRILDLKDGYEDPARVAARYQPDRSTPATSSSTEGAGDVGRVTTGAGASSSSGTTPPGSPSSAEPDPADAARSRGADQIDALRRGVSTTNSGGR